MDKRQINDGLTEIIASRLHYFDQIDRIDLTKCKARDIVQMTNGAIERYRSDDIFCAKVKTIVVGIMQFLDDTSRLGAWSEHEPDAKNAT